MGVDERPESLHYQECCRRQLTLQRYYCQWLPQGCSVSGSPLTTRCQSLLQATPLQFSVEASEQLISGKASPSHDAMDMPFSGVKKLRLIKRPQFALALYKKNLNTHIHRKHEHAKDIPVYCIYIRLTFSNVQCIYSILPPL